VKHLDAYTYAEIKDIDPQLILNLELTFTQKAEIAHHVNNALTIALWSVSQLDQDPKARERLKGALERIGKYVQTITERKAAS
jgi:hypothetical protein